MKLFLDTADSNEVRKWLYLIDGITTNPTHLAHQNEDPTAKIMELCSLLKNKHISVEVTEHAPEKVYAQAKKISALNPDIVVKIPCSALYYPLIATLVNEGVKINITLVFTLMQAALMAKLGVAYVSLFVGRWDDIDVDGSQLLYDIRDMIDRYGYDTQIIAASIRHPRHVHEAINAGADIITMPSLLLEKITSHPLTQQGIDIFDADWKKLGVTEFP